MENNVKLTILCVVYNHKDYIRRTIESFLNQKTEYKYEILIHDDASTDGTIDILKEYEKNYPDIIKVFYEQKNKYREKKLKDELYNIVENYAKGDYLAWCEGDDYWIDNYKVQLQLDYLENHRDCVMTAHNGICYDCRTGEMQAIDGFDEDKDVSMQEILIHKKNCFPTASMIMKKNMFIMDKPFNECSIGDWTLMIYCATKGKIHYFNRIMSVYRYMTAGSWSKKINELENYITFSLDMARFFTELNIYTKNEYKEQVDGIINGFYKGAAFFLLNNEVKDEALSELKNIVNDRLLFDVAVYWNELIQYKYEYKKYIERMSQYVEQHNRIYVMGTGDVSGIITEFLHKRGLKFDGYVISNNQSTNGVFYGKKVLHLQDVKGNKDDIGVIIAIKKRYQEEIENSLKDNGFSDFIWSIL